MAKEKQKNKSGKKIGRTSLFLIGIGFILLSLFSLGFIRGTSIFSPDNVVAYYSLDNNTYDFFGNYNGFFSGGLSNPFSITGAFDKAYKFNSSTGAIITSLKKIYGEDNGLTISFWAKCDSSDSCGGYTIIRGSAWADNAGDIMVGYSYNGISTAIATGMTQWPYNCAYISSSSLKDNRWHHVVYTSSNSAGRKIYLDDILVANCAAASFTDNPTNPFSIGAQKNGETSIFGNYIGSIDEVFIFNRSLNAVEITLINNPSCIPGDIINITAQTYFICNSNGTWGPEVCTVGSTKCVNGNTALATCDANQTWKAVSCGEGITCVDDNLTSVRCDYCTVGSTKCKNSGSLYTCKANGTFESSSCGGKLCLDVLSIFEKVNNSYSWVEHPEKGAQCWNTCQAQGGDVCLESERCMGIKLNAADSDRCCSETCTVLPPKKCSACGEGVFNTCDETECNSIHDELSKGCIYFPGGFLNNMLGGTCKSIDECVGTECLGKDICYGANCNPVETFHDGSIITGSDLYLVYDPIVLNCHSDIPQFEPGRPGTIIREPCSFSLDPSHNVTVTGNNIVLDFASVGYEKSITIENMFIVNSNAITIINRPGLQYYNLFVENSGMSVPVTLLENYEDMRDYLFIDSRLRFENINGSIEFVEPISFSSNIPSGANRVRLGNIVQINKDNAFMDSERQPAFNNKLIRVNFKLKAMDSLGFVSFNGVKKDCWSTVNELHSNRNLCWIEATGAPFKMEVPNF